MLSGTGPAELGGVVAIAMGLVRVVERLVDAQINKRKQTKEQSSPDESRPPQWLVEKERQQLMEGIAATQNKVLEVTQQQLQLLHRVTNVCVECPNARRLHTGG